MKNPEVGGRTGLSDRSRGGLSPFGDSKRSPTGAGKDDGATPLGPDLRNHEMRCACYSGRLEYNPRHHGQEESEAGQQQEEEKTHS